MSFIPFISLFCLIAAANGSIFIAKSKVLRQSPCLTPLCKSKNSEQHPFTLTRDFGFLYMALTQFTNSGWNPIADSVLYKKSQFTVSNAFCASKLMSIDVCLFFLAQVIMFRVLLILLAPCQLGMNPVWSGLISVVICFWTLRAKILVNNFWSLHITLMGLYPLQSVGSFLSLWITDIMACDHVSGGHSWRERI